MTLGMFLFLLGLVIGFVCRDVIRHYRRRG